MKYYAGLDVSMKVTNICILNEGGERIFESKAFSEPKAQLHYVLRAIGSSLNKLHFSMKAFSDAIGFGKAPHSCNFFFPLMEGTCQPLKRSKRAFLHHLHHIQKFSDQRPALLFRPHLVEKQSMHTLLEEVHAFYDGMFLKATSSQGFLLFCEPLWPCS